MENLLNPPSSYGQVLVAFNLPRGLVSRTCDPKNISNVSIAELRWPTAPLFVSIIFGIFKESTNGALISSNFCSDSILVQILVPKSENLAALEVTELFPLWHYLS